MVVGSLVSICIKTSIVDSTIQRSVVMLDEGAMFSTFVIAC